VSSSASSAAQVEPARLRSAHVALVLLFVVFGALGGTWDARLPALKERLALDSGQLGVVIFLVTLVATLLLPAAGLLASRWGSRGPIALGLLLASGGITAGAFAPSFETLLPAACVIGAGWGVADVASNAHGVAVEQQLGRPVLSALHGAWSFGLLAGSALAAGAAAASIGPRLQFPVVAGAAVVAIAVFVPRLLAGTAADLDTAHFALPRGALALPAFLMFCAFFVESAAISWTAVFLAGPVDTSGAVAAAGVAAFAVTMAFTRLVGDRLVTRLGVGGVSRWSGAITCAGIALALATRSPVPALIGFACVGVGTAPIVPALFRVGGSVPGVSASAGIAAVATAGYFGGVVNGPAIGFLARGIGLSGALSLIGVAAALIALLGPRLER
jgi:fucose permease